MNQRAERKAESETRGQQGSETGELRELRRRLSLAPSNTALRLRLARWLAARGCRLEALEELQALVRQDPNHLVARKLRAELMRQDGEPSAGGPEPPQAEALH